jgi:hypothetical protein
MNNRILEQKSRVIVDFGPTTIIILSEIILIILKILNYINFSWELILSPILLAVLGAVLILLVTLITVIKNHIF